MQYLFYILIDLFYNESLIASLANVYEIQTSLSHRHSPKKMNIQLKLMMKKTIIIIIIIIPVLIECVAYIKLWWEKYSDLLLK